MHTAATQPFAWFPLDNAAMLFPSIESDNRTGVFRLAITLDRTIDPKMLQMAVDRILPRFPTFSVQLVKGAFWHILDSNRRRLDVAPDVRNPCLRLDYRKSKGHLLRIRYFKKRIAVEFFHALTDGNGGMVFLLTLASEYLRQCGVAIGYSEMILNPEAAPEQEELEDAFLRHHRKGISRAKAEAAAYQLRIPVDSPGVVHHIQARIKNDDIIPKVKTANTTITGFLTAIYMLSLQTLRKRDGMVRRPIRVCIPVNLRSMFPSKTLRNFAHVVKPVLHPDPEEDYAFDEIVHLVNHQMALAVTPRCMLREFSPNVNAMTSTLLRIMPLFIKNIAIRLVSHAVAEKLFSGVFSNLGRIELPEDLDAHVESLDFQLGPNRKVGSSLSVLGYRDELRCNFVRTTIDAPIEREFFRELVRRGIPVCVNSNWR